MGKLELKHLAGYLPYGLKYKQRPFRDVNSLKLKELAKDGILETIIPILRPMSDLTKEIEVNGNKFVPIEKLREWFTGIYFEIGNHDKLNIKGKNETFICNDYFYLINQHLLEWHFDIYNGIGIWAIDINTL